MGCTSSRDFDDKSYDKFITPKHFEFLRQIGRGGFAEVFVARRLFGKRDLVAIKRIDKCRVIRSSAAADAHLTRLLKIPGNVEIVTEYNRQFDPNWTYSPELLRDYSLEHDPTRPPSQVLRLPPDMERMIHMSSTVWTEREIWQKIHSPFLSPLLHAFQDDDFLYFVVPFYSCGDLEIYLRRFGVLYNQSLQFIAAQIVLGLEALHSANIVYRDLKPQNILLQSNGHVVLADYGLCKINPLNGNGVLDLKGRVGTKGYQAPEILRAVGHSYPSDFFALGVTLYRLATDMRVFSRTPLTETNLKEARLSRTIYTRVLPPLNVNGDDDDNDPSYDQRPSYNRQQPHPTNTGHNSRQYGQHGKHPHRLQPQQTHSPSQSDLSSTNNNTINDSHGSSRHRNQPHGHDNEHGNNTPDEDLQNDDDEDDDLHKLHIVSHYFHDNDSNDLIIVTKQSKGLLLLDKYDEDYELTQTLILHGGEMTDEVRAEIRRRQYKLQDATSPDDPQSQLHQPPQQPGASSQQSPAVPSQPHVPPPNQIPGVSANISLLTPPAIFAHLLTHDPNGNKVFTLVGRQFKPKLVRPLEWLRIFFHQQSVLNYLFHLQREQQSQQQRQLAGDFSTKLTLSQPQPQPHTEHESPEAGQRREQYLSTRVPDYVCLTTNTIYIGGVPRKLPPIVHPNSVDPSPMTPLVNSADMVNGNAAYYQQHQSQQQQYQQQYLLQQQQHQQHYQANPQFHYQQQPLDYPIAHGNTVAQPSTPAHSSSGGRYQVSPGIINTDGGHGNEPSTPERQGSFNSQSTRHGGSTLRQSGSSQRQTPMIRERDRERGVSLPSPHASGAGGGHEYNSSNNTQGNYDALRHSGMMSYTGSAAPAGTPTHASAASSNSFHLNSQHQHQHHHQHHQQQPHYDSNSSRSTSHRSHNQSTSRNPLEFDTFAPDNNGPLPSATAPPSTTLGEDGSSISITRRPGGQTSQQSHQQHIPPAGMPPTPSAGGGVGEDNPLDNDPIYDNTVPCQKVTVSILFLDLVEQLCILDPVFRLGTNNRLKRLRTTPHIIFPDIKYHEIEQSLSSTLSANIGQMRQHMRPQNMPQKNPSVAENDNHISDPAVSPDTEDTKDSHTKQSPSVLAQSSTQQQQHQGADTSEYHTLGDQDQSHNQVVTADDPQFDIDFINPMDNPGYHLMNSINGLVPAQIVPLDPLPAPPSLIGHPSYLPLTQLIQQQQQHQQHQQQLQHMQQQYANMQHPQGYPSGAMSTSGPHQHPSPLPQSLQHQYQQDSSQQYEAILRASTNSAATHRMGGVGDGRSMYPTPSPVVGPMLHPSQQQQQQSQPHHHHNRIQPSQQQLLNDDDHVTININDRNQFNSYHTFSNMTVQSSPFTPSDNDAYSQMSDLHGLMSRNTRSMQLGGGSGTSSVALSINSYGGGTSGIPNHYSHTSKGSQQQPQQQQMGTSLFRDPYAGDSLSHSGHIPSPGIAMSVNSGNMGGRMSDQHHHRVSGSVDNNSSHVHKQPVHPSSVPHNSSLWTQQQLSVPNTAGGNNLSHFDRNSGTGMITGSHPESSKLLTGGSPGNTHNTDHPLNNNNDDDDDMPLDQNHQNDDNDDESQIAYRQTQPELNQQHISSQFQRQYGYHHSTPHHLQQQQQQQYMQQQLQLQQQQQQQHQQQYLHHQQNLIQNQQSSVSHFPSQQSAHHVEPLTPQLTPQNSSNRPSLRHSSTVPMGVGVSPTSAQQSDYQQIAGTPVLPGSHPGETHVPRVSSSHQQQPMTDGQLRMSHSHHQQQLMRQSSQQLQSPPSQNMNQRSPLPTPPPVAATHEEIVRRQNVYLRNFKMGSYARQQPPPTFGYQHDLQVHQIPPSNDDDDVMKPITGRDSMGLWRGLHSGFVEIKNHPFFYGLDWDLLATGKLKSPLQNFLDISTVEQSFSRQPIAVGMKIDNPEAKDVPFSPEEQNLFKGIEYNHIKDNFDAFDYSRYRHQSSSDSNAWGLKTPSNNDTTAPTTNPSDTNSVSDKKRGRNMFAKKPPRDTK